MADPFAAFGSDSDDSDNDDLDEGGYNEEWIINDSGNPPEESMDSTAAEAVALFLAQSLLKLGGAQVPLSQRRVAIWLIPSNRIYDIDHDKNARMLSVWKIAIAARGISVVTEKDSNSDSDTISKDACIYDVVLGISGDADTTVTEIPEAVPMEFLQRAWRSLVPGGSLLAALSGAAIAAPSSMDTIMNLDASFWKCDDSDFDMLDSIYYGPPSDRTSVVEKMTKLPCRIQEATAPWLPNSHDLHLERQRLAQSTVTLSSQEIRSHQLTDATVKQAVAVMQQTGFCVLPQLLDPVTSLQWGDAVIQDFHKAAEILLRDEQVDLYHPGESAKEPGTYRELSMREDLRLDLRSGPALTKLRGATSEQGNHPWTVKADTPLDHSETEFLRGHADLLQIIRRTMHPTDASLSPGNFGRYNFDGRGPDGSFPDVRVGPVGGILSLPGSADQAMHADTPHLFEHLAALPAHYINMFSPGSASANHVGQTALVPTSHQLDVTAEYAREPDSSRPLWWKDLVRPRLELGDVLLFDCRILHFGLANTSDNVERPLLYTNVTQHWFHDPKNWDDQRPIFPE
jgi:hypothetical protein